MNFTNHYYEDIYELNENLDEGLLGDIAKAGWTVTKKIYRTLKPKVKKFSNFKGVIDPANVTEVPCSVVDYLGGLLGSDLMKWRSVSKGKGMLQKFIMGGKESYVKDLHAGVIAPKIYDDFSDVFNLSDKWVLVSIDVYSITGGGSISLIRVSDPYEGEENIQQVKPSKVDEFTRKLQNQRCFISITGKGDAWFVNKTGMRFNQFINTRRQADNKKWREDIEKVLQSYEQEPKKGEEAPEEFPPEAKGVGRGEEPAAEEKPKVGGSKKVISLPDGRKIKLEYQFAISSNEFDKYGYSALPDNFKTKLKNDLDTIDTFNTDRLTGKIYRLKDGGQITLLKDKDKDKHFIVADKAGEDAMAKYDI